MLVWVTDPTIHVQCGGLTYACKLWHMVWPVRLRRDMHVLTCRSCCLSSGLMWLNSSLSTNWIAGGEIKMQSVSRAKHFCWLTANRQYAMLKWLHMKWIVGQASTHYAPALRGKKECFQWSVSTVVQLWALFAWAQELMNISTQNARGLNRTYSSLKQIYFPYWHFGLVNCRAVLTPHWKHSFYV